MTNIEQIINTLEKKRLKGNISLLIIFVLLASSVIALLAINQIQNLMSYGNMTFNYFRAHYIGKAWLELWLTEVYNRDDGFSTAVASWDSIVTENFVWWFNWLSNNLWSGESRTGYDWFAPYFTMTTTWSFMYLTNDITHTNECTSGNKIMLWTGEWVVISLFTDSTSWPINRIFSGESKYEPLTQNSIQALNMSNSEWETYTFGLFIFDSTWDNSDTIVKTGTDLSSFLNSDDVMSALKSFNSDIYKTYLTIKNSWTSTWSFCIGWQWLIPSSDSLITVQAHYWDMEIWLQSQVIESTPARALSALWLWSPENQ